jgi:hypothetical protein
VPVHGLTATGALLEPRKLAVIVALTAEMIAGSNAEALVTDALTRSVGLAIDAELFDDVAGRRRRRAHAQPVADRHDRDQTWLRRELGAARPARFGLADDHRMVTLMDEEQRKPQRRATHAR